MVKVCVLGITQDCLDQDVLTICRMLAVDNGMALDEGQAGQGRSSAGSDQAGQGLQWGTAPAAPTTISPTRKKSPAGKAVKEAKVRQMTTSHKMKRSYGNSIGSGITPMLLKSTTLRTHACTT